MAYFTYILQSSTTGRYYFGQTENLQNRLELHNRGRVPSTRSALPWELRFAVKCTSRSEAMKLEKQLKNLKSQHNVNQWMKRKAHLDCSVLVPLQKSKISSGTGLEHQIVVLRVVGSNPVSPDFSWEKSRILEESSKSKILDFSGPPFLTKPAAGQHRPIAGLASVAVHHLQSAMKSTVGVLHGNSSFVIEYKSSLLPLTRQSPLPDLGIV